LEGERAGQESPVREESETRRERKKRKKSLKAGRRQKKRFESVSDDKPEGRTAGSIVQEGRKEKDL